MAEVAAFLGEEIGVCDCHAYAPAETGPGHGLGELGDIMVVGIAGWVFGHVG